MSHCSPTAFRALLLGAALLPSASVRATPPVADAPFLDLSIDAAMERAREENKLLMIFWSVDWEPECRRLGTTWRDADVRAWCAERTVAIEVDGENDLTLPSRFNVKIYPTVLFVRPDGQEAARIVGYRGPQEFLRTAHAELEGREKGAQRPEGERAQDPMAWIAFANTIFKDPRHATEACQAYLWALDNGEEYEPGFRRQYFEFLVQRIASLKSKTEIARGALLDRRNEVARAMIQGEADDAAPGELVSLNYWSRRPTNSLLVYDQLAGRGERQEALRAGLFELILEDLAAQRRYDDILAGIGDPLAHVQRLADEYAKRAEEASSEEGEGGEGADTEDLIEVQEARTRLVTHAINVYEALLASGRGADAAKVFDVLAGQVTTGHTFALAMQRASRLELWDLVDGLAERGRQVLTRESGLDRLETAYRNHASPERLAPDPVGAPESERSLKRRLRQFGKKRREREETGDDDDGDGSGG